MIPSSAVYGGFKMHYIPHVLAFPRKGDRRLSRSVKVSLPGITPVIFVLCIFWYWFHLKEMNLCTRGFSDCLRALS